MDFIANASENSSFFVFTTLCLSRIVEAPMNALSLAWENGTGLVGIVADCDYVIERLAEKFVE